MTKGIDILKIFDLDLKLKVTEPFEGQKVTFSSSLLLKIESSEWHQKSNFGKFAFISVTLEALS